MPKNAGFFLCEICDFKCSKESNYQAHLATLKHEKFTKVYKKCLKTENALSCECLKTYTTRMGLWKHKQKCPIAKSKNDTVISSDLKDINSMDKDDLIIKLN